MLRRRCCVYVVVERVCSRGRGDIVFCVSLACLLNEVCSVIGMLWILGAFSERAGRRLYLFVVDGVVLRLSCGGDLSIAWLVTV